MNLFSSDKQQDFDLFGHSLATIQFLPLLAKEGRS
jgi:hypothetical protein